MVSTLVILIVLILFTGSEANPRKKPKGNFNYRLYPGVSPEKQFSFQYPDVRRDDSVIDDYNGTKISDPYRWLENPDSEETKTFVQSQNNLTIPYLEKAEGRDKIRNRLNAILNYTKYGLPEKRGNRYFSFMKTGLQNHGILYVHTELEGERKILIDPNTLSEDGTVAITETSPSNTGKIYAYGLSSKGSDWVKVYFKNVDTGIDYPDVLENTKWPGIEWTKDDTGVFYAGYPPPNGTADGSETTSNENMKIFFHRIGTKQSEDLLIIEFPEYPKRTMSVQISDDDNYLVVWTAEGLVTNLIFYTEMLPIIASNYTITNPDLTPLLIDNDARYEYLTSSKDGQIMYFRTNSDAPNYQLIGVYLNRPDSKHWAILLPEHKQNVLSWAAVVNQDKLVVCYIRDVKSALELRRMRDGSLIEEIDIGVATVGSFAGRLEDTQFLFSLSSFLSPGTVLMVDVTKPVIEPVVYRESAVEGFIPSHYKMKQIFFTSKDKTEVPMFIIHKIGIERDGKTPALLYGYGGFDISLQPGFSEVRLAFMQLFNGVIAVANIRGGGEYGARWHDGGRLLNKQNSFDDFQAAAEYLIEHRYTSPGKLAIQGGSNGGLLIGACINQRPELFGAAIAQVGVLDMLRYHKFTIGYSWASDYGTSENGTYFNNLLSYSPLHNIRVPKDDRIQYPATLVTTGDHDDRVVPLHSFKFIAELQNTIGKSSHQTNPLLILVETDAGHGGGKPTSKKIEETVDMFSFLIQTLNYKMTEPSCTCSW